MRRTRRVLKGARDQPARVDCRDSAVGWSRMYLQPGQGPVLLSTEQEWTRRSVGRSGSVRGVGDSRHTLSGALGTDRVQGGAGCRLVVARHPPRAPASARQTLSAPGTSMGRRSSRGLSPACDVPAGAGRRTGLRAFLKACLACLASGRSVPIYVETSPSTTTILRVAR